MDHPAPTQNRLLEWLDNGVESNGYRYREMRRRLVSYFDRRDRAAADELADETFRRIDRRLERAEAIDIVPPSRYCFVVARQVLLDDLECERPHVHADPSGSPRDRRHRVDELDGRSTPRQQPDDCPDRRLRELPDEDRALLIEYYRAAPNGGSAHRLTIAERMEVTAGALGVIASRLRDALMSSMKPCEESARQLR